VIALSLPLPLPLTLQLYYVRVLKTTNQNCMFRSLQTHRQECTIKQLCMTHYVHLLTIAGDRYDVCTFCCGILKSKQPVHILSQISPSQAPIPLSENPL
jgi:hypothetical protein